MKNLGFCTHTRGLIGFQPLALSWPNPGSRNGMNQVETKILLHSNPYTLSKKTVPHEDQFGNCCAKWKTPVLKLQGI